MPETAIRSDFHQPLDVERNLFAQISFDSMLFFDDLSDFVCIVVIQLTDLGVDVHAGGFQNVVRQRTSDPVDIRKSNFDSFVRRKIYASNARYLTSVNLHVACVSC